MKYLGSKNRISKYIAPIIQSAITPETKAYIEPFVGGANMIDKIDHPLKIGFDNNQYLIALLRKLQTEIPFNPPHIGEDEYRDIKLNKNNYPAWLVGYVGFNLSFGAKFFGGYAKYNKRNFNNEAIQNLRKQQINLKDIKFVYKDFKHINISKIKNCVIYCDPPYKNATKYQFKNFDYEYFYKWIKELSLNNKVFISEYSMPSEFTEIWNKQITISINPNTQYKTEKLYTL